MATEPMSEGKQEARESFSRYTPSIKQHVNGIWGLYLGEQFVAGFPTEVDAEIRLRLIQFALHDAAHQANQPQEKAQPESRWECPECGYKDMPTPPNNYHICPKCMVEFGNDDKRTKAEEREHLAFQRGQQAMAEKAVQLVDGRWGEPEQLNETGDVLKELAADIRSLASAEPPQGEAELPSNHVSVQRAVTGED